jgi:hypothetical protein
MQDNVTFGIMTLRRMTLSRKEQTCHNNDRFVKETMTGNTFGREGAEQLTSLLR